MRTNCKKCGIGFEPKRKNQLFHDRSCFYMSRRKKLIPKENQYIYEYKDKKGLLKRQIRTWKQGVFVARGKYKRGQDTILKQKESALLRRTKSKAVYGPHGITKWENQS